MTDRIQNSALFEEANEHSLREFFWWMCERQEIYRRRFVEDEAPPWTDDEILQKYHFCHVYRELDAGTKFVLNNIVNQGYDEADVLFNTTFYRLLKNPDSYTATGGFFQIDNFEADEVVRRLEDFDGQIFGRAYRIGHTMGSDYDELHKAIVYDTLNGHLRHKADDYVEVLTSTGNDRPNANDAMKRLTDIPQVGDFVAYEIMTDLCYGFVNYTENDFLEIGPGAEKGLEHIWGDTGENYVHWLTENGDELMNLFDLELYRWNGTEFKDLTLRAIEHSLCEYAKYVRGREQDNPNLRQFESGLQTSASDFMF